MEIQSIAQIHASLAEIEASAAGIADTAILPSFDQSTRHFGTSFADSLSEAVHSVDALGQAAAAKTEAVDSGRSDDLVGAMLASQEANLSFSMLMQVRNKVMGAFDELIKLQL